MFLNLSLKPPSFPAQKKQRETYNWLGQSDVASPPLLRTRQRKRNSNDHGLIPPPEGANLNASVAHGRQRRHLALGNQISTPASSSSRSESASVSRSSTPTPAEAAREAAEAGISVENEESNDSTESKEEAMETDENSNGKEDKGEEIAMDAATESEDAPTDIKKLKPVIEMPSPRTRPERGEHLSCEVAFASFLTLFVFFAVRRSKYGRPRSSIEFDLNKLKGRYEEVTLLLGDNKFTVATRKERGRLNELLSEKADLEEKIAKMKVHLEQNIV